MALYFSRNYKKAHPLASAPVHVVPFEFRIDVPTATGTTGPLDTAGNIVNIARFPRGAELVNEGDWVAFAEGETDSNVSPTQDVDLQVSANEDGSSGTTILDAGGVLGLATTATPTGTGRGGITLNAKTGLDLSEKWLQLKVAAVAATKSGTACTIVVRGAYTRQTASRQLDLTSAGDYDSGTTI